MKVARRYFFTATHYLPGVKGYDLPHKHHYTVEVVAEGARHDKTGMVIDTERFDLIAERLLDPLDGENLNGVMRFRTTVERLAEHFLLVFRSEGATQVTVWEDDDRWAQAP